MSPVWLWLSQYLEQNLIKAQNENIKGWQEKSDTIVEYTVHNKKAKAFFELAKEVSPSASK